MYVRHLVCGFLFFYLANALRAKVRHDDTFYSSLEDTCISEKIDGNLVGEGKEAKPGNSKSPTKIKDPYQSVKKITKTKDPATKLPCPDIDISRLLYRVTRPEESCQEGLIAKAPQEHKTLSSHVNCGSRPEYVSQYISFTSSPDIAARIKDKSKNKDANIVKVNLSNLNSACAIYDLTKKEVREKNVNGATARNFALGWCEVVVSCGELRIPCEVYVPLVSQS